MVIVARLAIVTTAVALCVCYVLGLISIHDQSRVTSLISGHGHVTEAQLRSGEDMLSEAKTLNPDPALDVLRAQLEFRAGHVAKAVGIAQQVVRRVPQDADAWLVLEILTDRVDPALNRLAHARLQMLVSPR